MEHLGTHMIGFYEAIMGTPNQNRSLAMTSWDGDHNHGGATGNSGSTETKPKNVALLYIIRAE